MLQTHFPSLHLLMLLLPGVGLFSVTSGCSSEDGHRQPLMQIPSASQKQEAVCPVNVYSIVPKQGSDWPSLVIHLLLNQSLQPPEKVLWSRLGHVPTLCEVAGQRTGCAVSRRDRRKIVLRSQTPWRHPSPACLSVSDSHGPWCIIGDNDETEARERMETRQS